ncbi:MAG: Ni/Fe-hydrogenase, b-type cytochrome subunit [Deltaproteobacteria bacterium]|nr:MAG: Ni/Fe-hydrogenase, b-type cytochrome subunit [Deltaproteobacteria bacterium]
MAVYEKQYCWSVLLRIYHVMFALSIVMLCVTGFYIASPWTNTMIEGSAGWPMAWMRFIHFLAGYVFSAAVLIRLYLFIFGNAQERIWDVLPINPRNIKNAFRTVLLYTYISDEHDPRLGHNVIAGLSYLFTITMAILMIISGFYMLFPEVVIWQKVGEFLFGSQQWARFIHHFAMWWFMIFAVIHVYLCVWNDVKEPEGLISSIVTGDKFVHK